MNRPLILTVGLVLSLPAGADTTDTVLAHYADLAHAEYIEKAVATMGLNQIAFEGSDSLDSPKKVFE